MYFTVTPLQKLRDKISPRTLDLIIIVFLVAFSSAFIFHNLGRNALIDWDESIYAGVSREILDTGEWVDLHWNKELWFEKPPLYFWLTAGAFKVFGVNEFAARFWSAVFGVGGVVVVYLFGKDMFDRAVGFISSLALLSTVHWVFQSRNGTLDVMASFLILLTLYLFWKAREQKRFWLWVGVALGLTFMTKSVVAVIPLVVMGLFAVVEVILDRGFDKYPILSLFYSLVAFLCVVLPWHIVELLRHGNSFWKEYFMYHVLARTRGIEGHDHPFFWYNIVIRHWARHWYVVLSPALGLLSVLACLKNKLRKRSIFLLIWFFLTFFVFSFSTSKIQWYITPIYPVIAIINAYLISYILSYLPSDFMVLGFVGLVASVPFFLLFVPSYKNLWQLPDYNRDIAETAQALPAISTSGDELLVYGISPGPPIFYGQRKVKTVNADMLFGSAADAERFFALSSDALLEDMESKGIRDGVTVFEKSGGYILFGRR